MRLRRTLAAVMVALAAGYNWIARPKSSTRRKNTVTTGLFQRDRGAWQLFRSIGIFWQVLCYIEWIELSHKTVHEGNT
jgi:hypothetical protein